MISLHINGTFIEIEGSGHWTCSCHSCGNIIPSSSIRIRIQKPGKKKVRSICLECLGKINVQIKGLLRTNDQIKNSKDSEELVSGLSPKIAALVNENQRIAENIRKLWDDLDARIKKPLK